jgi:hypothetical protein
MFIAGVPLIRILLPLGTEEDALAEATARDHPAATPVVHGLPVDAAKAGDLVRGQNIDVDRFGCSRRGGGESRLRSRVGV